MDTSCNTLDSLTFDNRFTGELPADPEAANYRRQVIGACYSRVAPTRVARPRLIAHSREVAELLNLRIDSSNAAQVAEVFSGNRLLPGMDPFAMCYGGHQFGNWAGQLGDGRAINLGEVRNGRGERWTLQLKGAGPTPYSRMADGLAVLRSSLREFLCSEAMHHLGVPTTRALSLVLTGEQVIRDMFYDGHPKAEPGAIVCRVAPSFTRFGNFEIFASRGDQATLRRLVDFTIRNDFPHLGEPSVATYAAWFDEVCRLTAEMIVHWMRVGFVHGVMNTDNMSILGLTIDYGPYGWLEDYDPNWTPNTTDAGGRRYRYGQQPQVALWNLVQLANAILPLFDDVQPLKQAIEGFSRHYEQSWNSMMAAKLGFRSYHPTTDADLITELHEVLQLVETDMTLFYRRLAEVEVAEDSAPRDSEAAAETAIVNWFAEAYYHADSATGNSGDAERPLNEAYSQRLLAWITRYRQRVRQDGTPDAVRRERMNAVNPKYVLRNYLAQLAIDAAEAGDYAKIDELLEVLRKPYDEQPGKEAYAEKRPEWARHRAGCSMLSCSS
ncbi:protein adenylyltransferase SelO [Candidatus Laterigemmans baculatus]|uniref:protein adenylyltransferase SelO n=1 Tax=Candidatus Laterigemmans baculatus TaxID=2770505 RepID=UPI0013DBBD77|nr:YdiU family protein [Candidatus Laterigemmans baculatus]